MTTGPIQNPRSKTAGRRPGDGAFRRILDGEIFVNQFDGALVTLDASGNLIENSLINPTAPTRPLNEQSTRVANMQALVNAITPVVTSLTQVINAITNFVRFDQGQMLNNQQQTQARANIGAQPALGFTPVHQGDGPDQAPSTAHDVQIGLGISVNALKVSVDGGDFGRIWTDRDAAVSLSANGYEMLPSGKITQWGSGTTDANGNVTWTYKTTFPNICLLALCIPDTTGLAGGVTAGNNSAAYGLSSTPFTVQKVRYAGDNNPYARVDVQPNLPVRFLAIGY